MQFSFCSDKNKNTLPCVEVLPRGWWLWQQADHHYWSQLQQYPAVTETGCFNSNLKTADQRRETCVISSPLTVHWWWRQTERMPGSCPSDQAWWSKQGGEEKKNHVDTEPTDDLLHSVQLILFLFPHIISHLERARWGRMTLASAAINPSESLQVSWNLAGSEEGPEERLR